VDPAHLRFCSHGPQHQALKADRLAGEAAKELVEHRNHARAEPRFLKKWAWMAAHKLVAKRGMNCAPKPGDTIAQLVEEAQRLDASSHVKLQFWVDLLFAKPTETPAIVRADGRTRR
jgi:hypothetical protein